MSLLLLFAGATTGGAPPPVAKVPWHLFALRATVAILVLLGLGH